MINVPLSSSAYLIHNPLDTKISTFTEDHKQMIVVKDIEVYSMRAPHVAFF
jgi:GTP cyclohydrolase I